MGTPRVWFITGTSSGMGLALTKVALDNGDNVVATLRKPKELEALASTYPSSQLLVLPLDVTDPGSIPTTFLKALEKFGRIDIVVNNAGCGAIGEFEATEESTARNVFDVNFWGMANVTREAIRIMKDVNVPQGGKILQISSTAALDGWGLLVYYSAVKSALIGFSHALMNELEPE